MWLVVGLGNPGAEYEHNRHNLGFMVVDELARRPGAGAGRAQVRRRRDVRSSSPRRAERVKAILCKPQEYMNVSGHAVRRRAAFYDVDVEHIVVVHDELDLPSARCA